MAEVFTWLTIFSIIAIWYAIGIKICRDEKEGDSNTKPMKPVTTKEQRRIERKRTQSFEEFIKSEAYKKIMSLEPIPYDPDPDAWR